MNQPGIQGFSLASLFGPKARSQGRTLGTCRLNVNNTVFSLSVLHTVCCFKVYTSNYSRNKTQNFETLSQCVISWDPGLLMGWFCNISSDYEGFYTKGENNWSCDSYSRSLANRLWHILINFGHQVSFIAAKELLELRPLVKVLQGRLV